MTYNTPSSIKIGGKGNIKQVEIGGNSPISIQTMWKESIIGVEKNPDALFSISKRINNLAALGCDIVRFAVPDMESAVALCAIADVSVLPVVADIHFDYKLALKCLDGNVSKIRINPGNIGSVDKIKAVVDKCKEKNVAIRVGINAGSLPKDLAEKVENKSITRAEALAETAFRETEIFNQLDFSNYCVSMKASSVKETIQCNELFASKYNIPLHIGVTEAGPLINGVVKSTLAFAHLLTKGIGSTIRVSLSDTPENEVITAREICGKSANGKGAFKLFLVQDVVETDLTFTDL